MYPAPPLAEFDVALAAILPTLMHTTVFIPAFLPLVTLCIAFALSLPLDLNLPEQWASAGPPSLVIDPRYLVSTYVPRHIQTSGPRLHGLRRPRPTMDRTETRVCY